MEIGIVLLTVTPSDPIAKILLPEPTALCSAGLEVSVPDQGCFYNASVELEVKVSSWPLWAPHVSESLG